MAAQGGVIFFDFQFLGLQFFVARAAIAGGRFTPPCGLPVHSMVNNFSCHTIPFLCCSWCLLRLPLRRRRIRRREPPDVSMVPNWPRRRDFQSAIFPKWCALGFNGKARPRNRFQAGLGDLFAGQFANAVSLFLDALEGFLNFINRVLVRRKQAQCEIAVKIIGARISHVEAVTRQCSCADSCAHAGRPSGGATGRASPPNAGNNFAIRI